MECNICSNYNHKYIGNEKIRIMNILAMKEYIAFEKGYISKSKLMNYDI